MHLDLPSLLNRVCRWMSSTWKSISSPRRKNTRFICTALESLETRFALSSLAGATPSGCQCSQCDGLSANYQLGSSAYDYYVADSKWPQSAGLGSRITITYSYSNLLDGKLGGGLAASTLKSMIQEALGRWAAVAPIQFVEVTDKGPLPSASDYSASGVPMLRFGHRFIDGASGVLAQAYYPGTNGLAGDIHFDTSEHWSTNPASGTDFLEVALHEIGHTLGLAHQAPNIAAIMNPSYSGRFRGLGTSYLLADDINGIRSLYGKGIGSVTTLQSQTPSNPTLPTGNPSGGTFILSGTTLYVNGTNGNDTVTLLGGSSPNLVVNGVAYTGNLNLIRTISIDARAGTDNFIIRGSGAVENYTIAPGRLTMIGSVWNVVTTNAENMTVLGGSGDTASLTDSTGNDTFSGQPGFSRLMGNNFDIMLRDIGSLSITANKGGYDRAFLYDSTGDDTLAAGSEQAVLSGTGYRIAAVGFEYVLARASDGVDRANLYDSAGNDIAGSSSRHALITGNNYGYYVLTFGFDQVETNSSTGYDVMYLYDSGGDDTFVSTSTTASMSNATWSQLAIRFNLVYAFSTAGGTDIASIYDSAGNDRFIGNGGAGTLYYDTSTVQFVGFSSALMNGLSGGINSRTVSGVNYSLTWAGLWS